MSRVVLLCQRSGVRRPNFQKVIEVLNRRLSPDNIVPNPPVTLGDGATMTAILNPTESVVTRQNSVCVGNMIDQPHDWWKPDGNVPDGSYALFRSSENNVELLTDMVASRTIWYVQTQEKFIASTSQRAVISLLEDFQRNQNALPWVLSCGSLGPNNSWDQRVRPLAGDSHLVLDRLSWKLTIKKAVVDFGPVDAPAEEHRIRLAEAIEDSFSKLGVDYSKWVLPLSGGKDSRGILLTLKNHEGLRSVTWGLRSSLNDKLNDAYIAQRLADHFRLDHRYFETDVSNESVEKTFSRYLLAGEGRIDHIPGYMDGFKIWKLLFEEKIAGVIRGDNGFGWLPVYKSLDVRRCNEILMLSDYSNLKKYREFGLGEQVLPAEWERKSKESLATWRDRLYHEFRIPLVLAALNDLKCAYIEVMNPLLCRKILRQVRLLPDSLRTDKKLWKEIVRAKSPDIRFAQRSAIDFPENIFRDKQVKDLIFEELTSLCAKTLFSSPLIRFITQRLEASGRNSQGISKARIKEFLPKGLRNLGRGFLTSVNVDLNRFAFRAFMVSKMHQILQEDAKALKECA